MCTHMNSLSHPNRRAPSLLRAQLAGAILDVHHQEPLPPDSPMWRHPKIRIFPHVASTPHVPSVAKMILHHRKCILEGRPLPKEVQVDRQRGY